MDEIIDLGATDGSDIEIISENITTQWRRRKIKRKINEGGRTKIHVKHVNTPIKDNQESYIKEEIIISDASDCSENEDSKYFNTKTSGSSNCNNNRIISKKKQPNPNDSLSSIILNCPRCNKTETVFSTTIKCICKDCKVNMYYVCEKCNFRYESMFALYRHKKFQCNATSSKDLSPLKLFIQKCSKCNASRKVIHVNKDKCSKCKIEMSYECAICSKSYNSYSGLYQHWKLQCQPKKKVYYCNECSFKCTCDSLMLQHITKHHSEVFPLTEVCSKCGKSLSLEALKRHEAVCRLPYYHCEFCIYKPKLEERLRKHLLSKHKKFVPNQKELKKAMLKANNKRNSLRTEGKLTTKEDNDHAQEKLDLKLLRATYCPGCDKREDLQGMATKCPTCDSEFEFECRRCKRRFVSRQSLCRHVTRLHGTQSYRCHSCQRRFAFYGDANEHRKTCGQEPNFECEICFFKTRYKHNLLAHMAKLHNENRPIYSCPQCAVEYKTLEPLKKHIRLVHGKQVGFAVEELKRKK